MSIFDNMANNLGNWLADRIAPKINDRLGVGYSVLGTYYTGDHRKQLKVREGKQDDNIILNFVGLAVDRSVSRLFRGGVKWMLPEGADEQGEYLDKVWDLSKQEILCYQLGLHGAVYGTVYVQVAPDGVTDPYTGKQYPRLIPLDPEIVRIKPDPRDMSAVLEYRIEYKIVEQVTEYTSQEVAYREIYRRDGAGWVIEYYEQHGGGQMKLVQSVAWAYDFPPILHWKNLPSLKSCYGDSDIDDAINIQDKENFVVSNTAKIVKHHASPKTVGTGFSADKLKPVDDSPESMLVVPAENAKVFNLEMNSDLPASHALALSLRQSIFDISREVDITSVVDKLGALTNFGLRVLWTDAMDKNDTKRQLYGDAFKELNRRLLVLAGWTLESSDPGAVQWGNAMIVNVMEELQADQLALDMGIIDKGSVMAKYEDRYGKSTEEIQEAIKQEQEQANQQNADIGSFILRNFNRGEGAEQPAQNRQQNAVQMATANNRAA